MIKVWILSIFISNIFSQGLDESISIDMNKFYSAYNTKCEFAWDEYFLLKCDNEHIKIWKFDKFISTSARAI